MDIAITGSHGFLASHLIPELQREGHRIVPVVRGAPGPGEIGWDIGASRIDASGLEGIGAVIHLAGEGIGDKRWTAAQKRRIKESRARGTRLMAETIATLQNPPATLVSASAIGFYGNRGDEVLTEESPPGTGFIAEVVKEWEDATEPATKAGIRVVTPRSGIVLGRGGGALPKMALPFRFGLGAKLGSGRQWFSWVSIKDEIAGFIHMLKRDDLSGPVNLAAPHPVTNAELTKTLARVLHRPAALTVPRFALKAVLGAEMTDEGLLAGQRVIPEKLSRSGYQFHYAELEPALRAVFNK